MFDISAVKADLFSVPHYKGPLSIYFVENWGRNYLEIDKDEYATVAHARFTAGRPEGRRSEFFDLSKEDASKWVPKGTDPATRMFGIYDITPSGIADYRVAVAVASDGCDRPEEAETPTHTVLPSGNHLTCTVWAHLPKRFGEDAKHVFFDITQERLRQAAILYLADSNCIYTAIDCPGIETFMQPDQDDDRYYEISFSFPVRKERQNG
jgi:hypothetical protein